MIFSDYVILKTMLFISPRCRYHQVLVGATRWRFKSSRAHYVAASLDGLLFFRKKSRSAHLLGCKRPREGSLSLPPFCGCAPAARAFQSFFQKTKKSFSSPYKTGKAYALPVFVFSLFTNPWGIIKIIKYAQPVPRFWHYIKKGRCGTRHIVFQ